jgi:hypothetical protein
MGLMLGAPVICQLFERADCLSTNASEISAPAFQNVLFKTHTLGRSAGTSTQII